MTSSENGPGQGLDMTTRHLSHAEHNVQVYYCTCEEPKRTSYRATKMPRPPGWFFLLLTPHVNSYELSMYRCGVWSGVCPCTTAINQYIYTDIDGDPQPACTGSAIYTLSFQERPPPPLVPESSSVLVLFSLSLPVPCTHFLNHHAHSLPSNIWVSS